MYKRRYAVNFKAVQEFTVYVDATSLDGAIDEWLDIVQQPKWFNRVDVFEETDPEAVTDDEPMIDIVMP